MKQIELEVLGVHVDRAMPMFWKGLEDGSFTPSDMLDAFGFLPPIEGATGSFSAYAETHIIDHAAGKTSWTMPATVALALCTTLPTVTSIGSTLVEATYTGYGRQTIAGTVFNAASGSNPAANATNATITFAACTASSSTIVGWALCDSATTAAGNVIMWGSCASTVVSTTQTPATVASGALTMSLT